MDYSSPKPLRLQVYKTPNEFKAFQLNRAEQTRLDCERTYLTKQERTFRKDFKTSRIKVEENFMRRLSVAQDPQAPMTPTNPWSASTTPRVESAVSTRRSSEAPRASSYSSRRGFIWSLPESLARGRVLQSRRQTYGGGSAGFPNHAYSARSMTSRGSVCAREVSTDCGFCDKLSQLVHAHAALDGVPSFGESSGQTDKELMQDAHTHDVGGPHNGSASHTHTHSAESAQNAHTEVPVVTVDTTDAQVSQENGEAKDVQQQRLKVKSAGPLRSSISKAAPILKPNGVGNVLRPGDKTPMSNGQGDKESTGNKSDVGSVAVSDTLIAEPSPSGVSNSGKSDKKVSIMEPPSDCASVTSKTQFSEARLLLPDSGDSINAYADIVLEHAKQCPAGEQESLRRHSSVFVTYRAQSAGFANPRRQSESVGDALLRCRVSQFLDEQKGFNRRFPLKRHEIKSLECARPDLLLASKAKEKSDMVASKRKAKMVAEVLEKLGLDEHVLNTAQNSKLQTILLALK